MEQVKVSIQDGILTAVLADGRVVQYKVYPGPPLPRKECDMDITQQYMSKTSLACRQAGTPLCPRQEKLIAQAIQPLVEALETLERGCRGGSDLWIACSACRAGSVPGKGNPFNHHSNGCPFAVLNDVNRKECR